MVYVYANCRELSEIVCYFLWLICLDEVNRKHFTIASNGNPFGIPFHCDFDRVSRIESKKWLLKVPILSDLESQCLRMRTIFSYLMLHWIFICSKCVHLCSIDQNVSSKTMELWRNIPGSVSKPWGGCCDNGPGVLPLPGDRTSSFIAPTYDNDELGGRWKCQKKVQLMSFI